MHVDVLKAMPHQWFTTDTLNQLDTLTINDFVYYQYFNHIQLYVLYPNNGCLTWSPDEFAQHHNIIGCHYVYKVNIKKQNQNIILIPFGIKCEWQLIDNQNYYTSFNLL
jgi:hypothetical protein